MPDIPCTSTVAGLRASVARVPWGLVQMQVHARQNERPQQDGEDGRQDRHHRGEMGEVRVTGCHDQANDEVDEANDGWTPGSHAHSLPIRWNLRNVIDPTQANSSAAVSRTERRRILRLNPGGWSGTRPMLASPPKAREERADVRQDHPRRNDLDRHAGGSHWFRVHRCGVGFDRPDLRVQRTWQLVINTGTTILTFNMVFVIQAAQNRDGAVVQAKLDEILGAIQGQTIR
jgi:hypothetical protein